MQRVLIVGFGYVAKYFYQTLPQDKYMVTSIRRSKEEQKYKNLVPFQADLNDISTLKLKKEKPEFVLYCPSPDHYEEDAYRKVYIDGLLNLLKVLDTSNIKRFIYISSTSVYGQTTGEWVDENSETNPTTFGGKILLKAESLLYSKLSNSTVIRLGGIYGLGRNTLIQRVKDNKIKISDRYPRYVNRIHVEDSALMIKHIIELTDPQALYIGVDHAPEEIKLVLEWIASNIKFKISPDRYVNYPIKSIRSGNKRCRNDRIVSSGFHFKYPTYKKGYAGLLDHS